MPILRSKQKTVINQRRIKESNLKFLFDSISSVDAISRADLAQMADLRLF